MKVLMVISHGFEDGGAERSVMLMQAELQKRGHEVRILSADNHEHPLFSDYQFPPVPNKSPFKFWHHLFYMASYKEMRRVVQEFQPDVIHFHTLTACSPSVLFATGQTPAVMTIHGPEEFTLKLLPWFFSPADYTRPGFNLADLTLAGRLKYWYYRWVQRPIYRRGVQRLARVIVPSRYMKSATQADFKPVPQTLIHNGIMLPQAQPIPQSQRLLYVGRLESLKGIDILLQAAAQVLPECPQLSLHIVGNGSDRPRLEELSHQLGLSKNVTFTGWRSPGGVQQENANANILVVPSLCPEAFGLVAIEAMAIGRPVIGTQLGGLTELIEHNRTGLTVPPGDVEGLASAIKLLITNQPLQQQFGEAAAKQVQVFSIKRFIDETQKLYTELASTRL